MKKKNIKETILFAIIFCFLIIALLVIIILKNNSENDQNIDTETVSSYENVLEEVNNEFLEKKEIVPENYNFLVRLYEGNVKSSYMFSEIYKTVFEVIPEVYNQFKESDNEKIINYYNENTEKILNSLGITSQEEYLKFVNVVCNLNNFEYNNAIFDIQTLQNNGEYSNLNLEINFKEDNKIVFNFCIINEITDGKPKLKFLIN